VSDFIQARRSKLPPPAAGQFGLGPCAERVELRAYRPAGCPTLEQFEARFTIANDPHHPPRAA
jgi:hypothetical protein